MKSCVKQGVLIAFAFVIMYKMGQYNTLDNNPLIFTVLYLLAYSFIAWFKKIKD